LEIGTLTLPIEGAHEFLAGSIDAALQSKGPLGATGLVPVADENLQSRLRGLHLMAVSNSTGTLVLTTGNKSEYAAGYTTLYGDMCGGLAPIGDVLKTDVWTLAAWVNAHHQSAGFARPPIPQQSVDKVPSAELRPNQTDQDTLPPYHELDAIVRHWVEEECSIQEVAQRSGLPLATVTQWTQAIDRAEFKRDQAPIILKVTARAFGRGRPMPLAQQWRPS
jgi:NAD+ synthase (glutamine-hydrolysing)